MLSAALPTVAAPSVLALMVLAFALGGGFNSETVSVGKTNAVRDDAPAISSPEPQIVQASLPGTPVAIGAFAPTSPPAPASPLPQLAPVECGDFVDAAGALPSPCRAGVSTPGESLVALVSQHSLALAAVLDAVDRRDFAGAQAAAAKIDGVANDLVSWMAATSITAGLKSSQIADTMAALSDWPGRAQMRARYEEALGREHPDTSTVLKIFADTPPTTAAGTVLYAKALAGSGREEEANALVRRYWRQGLIAADGESAILSAFGGVLVAADHQARAAWFLYQGRTWDAERAARPLDKGLRDLFTAWIAATRQRRDADKLLDKVPSELRQEPGYLFARIEALRQAGRIGDAAAMMQSAPTDATVLVDPDAWSEERQLLARDVAVKDPRLAWTLTAANVGASPAERMDAEFEAGWYALRYLDNPATAAENFRISASLASGLPVSLASGPIKQARAEYWCGRAADALGQVSVAADHYRAAGRFATTFYGQLALMSLGSVELPIAPPPTIDEKTERRFLSRELVQVAGRLTSIGRNDEAGIFYRYLAETLTDPAEIALLARMVEREDNYALALQVGKVAIGRQAGVDAIAFPIAAVPTLDRSDVEVPAVYAVARQESAFQVAASSPAGAKGLLQLMPATAREVAGRLGMPFSADRLSRDPTYNTTLGAAFLGSLVAHFNGSYAMSFAAYNAGEGRVQEWAKTYGDPRGHEVDVIDWIERIPYDETRNYVQRTLENLQVYRARMGLPALRLADDLTGHPGGWSDPLAIAVARRVPAQPPKPAVSAVSADVAADDGKVPPTVGDQAGAAAADKATPTQVIAELPKPRHPPTDSAKTARVVADNGKPLHGVADAGKGKRSATEIVKARALADKGKGQRVVADNGKSRDARRVLEKGAGNRLATDRPVCTRNSTPHGADAAHRLRRCVA
jgi:soluble lytic murein transglycosylase